MAKASSSCDVTKHNATGVKGASVVASLQGGDVASQGTPSLHDSIMAHETVDMLMLSQKLLMKALDGIPNDEKQEYVEALHRSPKIVAKESDPIRFLRVEHYQPEAAARRLVQYWKYRKAFFGERGFQSILDLTGNGALTNDNIWLLETGGVAQLPDADSGRPVLCVDLTRLDLQTSNIRQHRLRCIFFWHTKLSMENVRSQTEGFEFVRVINSSYFDAASMQQTFRLIECAMPLKMHRFHLCCSPSAHTKKYYIENLLPNLVQFAGKEFGDRVTTHVAKSKGKLCSKLVKSGFNKQGLPESLGGTWSYSHHECWLEEARKGFSPLGRLTLAGLKDPAPPSPPIVPFASLQGCSRASPTSREVDAAAGPRSILASTVAGASDRSMLNIPDVPRNQVHALKISAAGMGNYSGAMSGNLMDFAQQQFQQEVQESPEQASHVRLDAAQESSEQSDACELAAAMQHFEDALSVIPRSDMEEYLEAMKTVPHIVMTETDPLKFLAVEGNNGVTAAMRMIKHWKYRKSLFGDRAFRPMRMTGDGALNVDDIRFLASGATVLLPNDAQGCPVLCSDLTRVNIKTSEMKLHRERCLFYWFTKISMENDNAVLDGLVYLRLVNTTSFDPGSLESCLKLLDEAMPVKLRAIHLCCLPCAELSKHFVIRMIPILVDMLRKDFGNRVHAHMGGTENELLSSLVRWDLRRECMPTTLAGSWSYDTFNHWIFCESSGRKAAEDPPAALNRKRKALESSSKVPHGEDNKLDPLGFLATAATNAAKECDRRDRKRRIDAAYARDRRQREKHEYQQLQQECTKLSKEQMALQAETTRLEQLHKKANDILAEYVMGTSQAAASRLPPNIARTISEHGSADAARLLIHVPPPSLSPRLEEQTVPPGIVGSALQKQSFSGSLLGFLHTVPTPGVAGSITSSVPASSFVAATGNTPMQATAGVMTCESSHLPQLGTQGTSSALLEQVLGQSHQQSHSSMVSSTPLFEQIRGLEQHNLLLQGELSRYSSLQKSREPASFTSISQEPQQATAQQQLPSSQQLLAALHSFPTADTSILLQQLQARELQQANQSVDSSSGAQAATQEQLFRQLLLRVAAPMRTASVPPNYMVANSTLHLDGLFPGTTAPIQNEDLMAAGWTSSMKSFAGSSLEASAISSQAPAANPERAARKEIERQVTALQQTLEKEWKEYLPGLSM